MNINRLRSKLCGMVLLFMVLTTQSAFAEPISKTTSYIMDVQFNEDAKTLSAAETVSFTNNYGEDLKEIVFHLYPDSYGKAETMPSLGPIMKGQISEDQKGDIDIIDVTYDGQKLNYTEDNQVLKIMLLNPLKSNDSIELKINFKLKIPQGFGRLGYNDDIFSLTNWYPILSIYDPAYDSWDENPFHPIGESNYSDVSDYDIKIHIPSNFVIASTGVTANEETSGNEKVVKVDAENVRDFVFMLSKNYKVISKDVSGIKVNSYYIRDEVKPVAQRMLDFASSALLFYSDSFGKYPYPELDVVETPLSGGAMEYPQLIQMGRYPYFQNADQNRDAFYTSWLDEAIVHETGHQWWYVSVGNNEFKEPFMDESLTCYSTAYYFEKQYGKYDRRSILTAFRAAIYPSKTEPFDSSVDDFKNMSEYNTVIYNRAPIVLEDLRSTVGDEKFLNIMRNYFKKYLFKNGTINDFLNVIKETAGDDVAAKIKKAISSTDYYPENLVPTKEETKEINKRNFVENIKQQEQYNGMIPGSILVRGMGGKIHIITPEDPDENNKKTTSNLVKNLKSYSDSMGLGVQFAVEDSSKFESSNLKENLILIGNNENNEIINKMSSSFPVVLSSKGLLFDEAAIAAKDYSGYFLISNPNNAENIIIVISPPKDEQYYNLDWYGPYQYDFKVNGKMEIKGKF